MPGNVRDVTLHKVCPNCGVRNEIVVSSQDLEAWKKGTLIQVAFPYLNADEREVLKTGTCTACWDKLYGEEEERLTP